ncbi:MAG: uracil-DNA glycosylase [bacterium]
MVVKMESSWRKVLAGEFARPYFEVLSRFVDEEYLQSKKGVSGTKAIFPPSTEVFRAFDLCPFDQVKVIILGQDPYHGAGQANGLCFAVNKGVVPPSLKNIFKELVADLGPDAAPEPGACGDLSRWAKQGVLLLNATLTVRANTPGSHQGKGWEEFTDAAVSALSREKEGLVFMLWGNYAKKKGAMIDRSKHLVLEAAHPSPFSAYDGFFGCKHFSRANAYLKAKGISEVDWR